MSSFVRKARFVDLPSIIVVVIAVGAPLVALFV
jgi:hypothetical protein